MWYTVIRLREKQRDKERKMTATEKLTIVAQTVAKYRPQFERIFSNLSLGEVQAIKKEYNLMSARNVISIWSKQAAFAELRAKGWEIG